MSSISKYKNGWLLLLFIMIGIVIGGLISEGTAGVSGSHTAIRLASTVTVIHLFLIWEYWLLHLLCRLRLQWQVLLA